MEAKLIVLTLCFIGTVFLWGTAAQTSPSPAPSSPSSIGSSMSPQESESTTGSNTESTPEDNTSGTPQTTMLGSDISRPNELSEGEIAGIVIGTIAGVALIGGGIFGALKYTGKI